MGDLFGIELFNSQTAKKAQPAVGDDDDDACEAGRWKRNVKHFSIKFFDSPPAKEARPTNDDNNYKPRRKI